MKRHAKPWRTSAWRHDPPAQHQARNIGRKRSVMISSACATMRCMTSAAGRTRVNQPSVLANQNRGMVHIA